uniref:Uncharacterized protein n=1 Tax=Mycena chlorophos TaxID=658473 RepID=A0ABQ0LH08_MYCCL|nr:predicted protein [Mycena chlorophos]
MEYVFFFSGFREYHVDLPPLQEKHRCGYCVIKGLDCHSTGYGSWCKECADQRDFVKWCTHFFPVNAMDRVAEEMRPLVETGPGGTSPSSPTSLVLPYLTFSSPRFTETRRLVERIGRANEQLTRTADLHGAAVAECAEAIRAFHAHLADAGDSLGQDGIAACFDFGLGPAATVATINDFFVRFDKIQKLLLKHRKHAENVESDKPVAGPSKPARRRSVVQPELQMQDDEMEESLSLSQLHKKLAGTAPPNSSTLAADSDQDAEGEEDDEVPATQSQTSPMDVSVEGEGKVEGLQ